MENCSLRNEKQSMAGCVASLGIESVVGGLSQHGRHGPFVFTAQNHCRIGASGCRATGNLPLDKAASTGSSSVVVLLVEAFESGTSVRNF